MIISRTPMRNSFVGGATDIENFYSKYEGEVVSCGINKYIYITYNKRDDNKIVISYSKLETVDNVEEIKHPIVREALTMSGVKSGFESHVIAKLSTIGTGLGGSSALAVGLLRVLYPEHSQEEIAEMACDLEINKLNKCIGKQDQYACALGGINHLRFKKDGSVKASPILYHDALKNSMFLINATTENSLRQGTEVILNEQNKNFEQNQEYLLKIRDMCRPFIEALNNNDKKELINILNNYWNIKRKLSNFVSNEYIDSLVDKYISQDCGVKLCGAGQGGYMFVYDPTGKCNGIPIEIDYSGTMIIYND